MGLSFHNETSESSVVGSLRFAADDSNSTMGAGGDNPNSTPEEISISEERRDDEIGGNDVIQNRW
jgi:hypothetical protein